MAIHDAYARFTPYELLLPDPEFPDRCFGAIAREAEERGADPGNPAAFVMLGAVQGALAELREEDAGPESAHDHAGILFFAYHLWRTEGEVVLAQRDTLRDLLAEGTEVDRGGEPGSGVGEGGAAEEDGGAGPSRGERSAARERESAGTGKAAGRLGSLLECSGYVQLPQHLVWIESPDQPPESVDGFFWFGDGDGVLHLAVVAGMRRDRPGCVVVNIPPQPLDAMPGWASGPAREEGCDFATSLPGARMDGLMGIRTPAEVFKLASLVLGRVAATRPKQIRSPADPPAEGSKMWPTRCGEEPPAADHDPRPSRLPFANL